MAFFNCAQQHNEHLSHAFSPSTCENYKEIHIRKLTTKLKNKIIAQLQQNNTDFCMDIMLHPTKPHPKTVLGTWSDLKRFWKIIYTHKSWDKIATFNDSGIIKASYLLCKHKHVIGNPTKINMKKTRIITPFSKHPMKTLLRAAARAWMFILKKWKHNDTILQTCQQLPEEIEQMLQHNTDTVNVDVWDIDGFFPSMPKADIISHMKGIIDETSSELNALMKT